MLGPKSFENPSYDDDRESEQLERVPLCLAGGQVDSISANHEHGSQDSILTGG